MELFLAFVAGMSVMDLAWAWCLGIPQVLWSILKLKLKQKQSGNG